MERRTTFEEEFAGKESDLEKKLDSRSELLTKLKDMQILTDYQVQKCEAEQTDRDVTKLMLSYLKKADDSKFAEFCRALIDTNQQHIIEVYFPSFVYLIKSAQPTMTEGASAFPPYAPADVTLPASSTTKRSPFEVFVSCPSELRPQVAELCNKLTSNGIRCRKDDTIGGVFFVDDRGISACQVFLACITKEYCTSTFCRSEIQHAFNLNKKIIPLRMDDTKWPPAELASFMTKSQLCIDFRPANDTGVINWDSPKFDQLIRNISVPDGKIWFRS